ncbi:hypothetical protein [Priestia megaterium]|uniref:hypothetical protein n=1 Tax=Priestia megaterium TaxID=1404 RepID=UPI0028775003|nr:hypothetical protein [Priestia megaterium]
MLIIFTIFFLTFYLVVLAKGGIARGLAIEIAKEDIKKQKEGADNYQPNKELAIKMLPCFVPLIGVVIVQFLYYCFSLNSDPFLFPTLIMLLYMVLGFVYNVVKPKKKADLTVERNAERHLKKLEKRSLKGTLQNLVYVTYFAYMLFAAVFMG